MLLNTGKKKGLQMGYINLKGKVECKKNCKKTSESNAESIGWVYLFSSAIKIWNCGGKKYYATDAAFVHVKKLLSCSIYWNNKEWQFHI